ncbi:hypothetical protein L207DRAFT_635806 [Hyaloscypha variabilis F]|uniref:Uncharacterized protein n=1 Tax=Hyaloscypha variabilis (strain UAMH 11265 / GT02V1 / F) TaxID=1149755 RepID=A0A2J6RIZ6_HYAVF|nr:hypothetical protein L207DRAFT_635806 [Hyaloscypha variabilis F]
MLRIKRFISHHRKPPIHDPSRNSFEDLRFTDRKLPTNSTKRLSWISQSPSIDNALRRSNSQATLRTYHNRTTSATAHSSATSLCSCDCALNPASIEPPLSREVAVSNHPEILYLPPLSPGKASDDAQAWRLIFSESPSRSPASSISKSGQKGNPTATIAAGSTFDLIGALALEAPNEDKTPTQSLKYTYDSEMEDFTDNVEQLIRETDAAFQAVGNALADAKAATRGWYDDEVPVARNTSLASGILRKHPRSSVPPLKTQALRSMSVAKKKKKPPKRNLLGRALRSPPPPANTPSRWTLGDVTTNMVDVFSGKIFRTEVDEMLTPGRRQKLQESIRLSHEHRESADSARGTEAEDNIDTPTEPFCLENLSSRLDAAQDEIPPIPSPVLPPPAIPKRHPKRPSRPQARKVQFTDNEAGMTINEITFPTPPRISRRPSTSGNIPHLPTIPEVSPLTLSPFERFSSVPSILQTRSLPEKAEEREQEKYIYLPCTPFTLTSPLFRHGTIRVPIPYREPNLKSDEEALDWTAFQMAISGTGGIDGFSEPEDREERERAELEEMEREVDDIVVWWAGFAYQGWGRMVGDETLTSKRRGRESSMRRKRREDTERAEALEMRKSPRQNESLKRIVDTEKIVVVDGSRPGNANEAQRRQSFAESLPPSPMLDLVVPSPSKDNDVIPMGFNLGHDLGDFLRWETHHVQTLLIDDR